MAPKPRGFNLWGYLRPGVAIGAATVTLVSVLRRREAVASAADSGERTPGQPVSASQEELERVRRALQEVED